MKDTISTLEVHDEGSYSVTITNRLGNCDTTSDAIPVRLLEKPPSVTIEAGSDTGTMPG